VVELGYKHDTPTGFGNDSPLRMLKRAEARAPLCPLARCGFDSTPHSGAKPVQTALSRPEIMKTARRFTWAIAKRSRIAIMPA